MADVDCTFLGIGGRSEDGGGEKYLKIKGSGEPFIAIYLQQISDTLHQQMLLLNYNHTNLSLVFSLTGVY